MRSIGRCLIESLITLLLSAVLILGLSYLYTRSCMTLQRSHEQGVALLAINQAVVSLLAGDRQFVSAWQHQVEQALPLGQAFLIQQARHYHIALSWQDHWQARREYHTLDLALQ